MDKPGPMPTYADAPASLIAMWNQRRRRLGMAAGEALPPVDCDLEAMLLQRVPEGEELPPRPSTHAIKRHEVRKTLVGYSELAALNGLLISHLRKKAAPPEARPLFHRIWSEHGTALLHELPVRWLISSAITFGDHGLNEAQRSIGLSMNILFSLIKLYEFERAGSGIPADEPQPIRPLAGRTLPLDMPGFSLLRGGLDINLLAQIWKMAGQDPVAGPIAHRLLSLLNDDPRGLFRRLNILRDAHIRHRNAKAGAGPDHGTDSTEVPSDLSSPRPEAGEIPL